jgi:arabinose-5-phosphate isomerase
VHHGSTRSIPLLPSARPSAIQFVSGHSFAILEMSTKGFGCIGITDARGLLVGIITDGDLRRHMRNNLLDARVHDLITHRPKTARPDQLISETLNIPNTLKVTALFAVGAGKPVGIIHVHDLLRAGAA